MFQGAREKFSGFGPLLILLSVLIILCAGVAYAQETGGELGGGAGIFRPKNPEAKHSSGGTKPTGKPTARPTGPSPAEIEAKFQDALADGNEARDAHKFTAAETAYREATKLKPRDARGFYGLGNVFVDQQRWDEAEEAYRKAHEFAPNDPQNLIALSFALVQPRTGAGNAKRFADAEYFARRATQIEPTNAVAFDRLGVALVARALFHSDTEAAFRRAVELDPNFVVAKVHLARVLRHLNRSSEADSLYQAAIEQAKDAPTLVLIADALQSEQRWPESETVLRRALQMDDRNPGALFLLGRMLAAYQKYAEAEPVLAKAIEVSPKSFPAHNILARTYLGLERYDDAFKTYERAAALASDADRRELAGQFGFGGVGDGYMKAGRPRDALRAYERAQQLDPNNAELANKITAARAKL
jgi:tetratricopeptide (TPR) repeat protein